MGSNWPGWLILAANAFFVVSAVGWDFVPAKTALLNAFAGGLLFSQLLMEGKSNG